MPLPARKHFPLDEVAEAWGTTARMLLEYGAEEQLEIAVPLFGAQAELCGDIEGQGTLVLSRNALWGAKPLFAEDLWRLHGHGTVRIERVRGNDTDSWHSLLDSQLQITVSDLVITAGERKRFEAEHELADMMAPEQAFQHSTDYRSIAIGGRQFTLSPKRADIVRVLHMAWRTGTPWMTVDGVMQAAGCESSRMVDVFGPLEGWRTILTCDRAGNWRINLPDPVRESAPRRAFRRSWLRLVR